MKAIERKDLQRLLFLSLFLLLLFFFIIFQFYKLQIIEGKKWRCQARAQHQFRVIEPYKRGRFFGNCSLKERHPHADLPLVYDIKRYHLCLDPVVIPEELRSEIAQKIGEILKLSEPDCLEVRRQFDRKSRSRRLKSWLSEEERKPILAWWKPYAKWKKIPRNALFFEEDYKRAYPYGTLLGPVLHTVRDDRDPETGQPHPTGGLELSFNETLQGKPGKRVLMRSPSNPMEEGFLITPPEDGADVYLTIDPMIQAIAEEEIQLAVQMAGAKKGWVVMMNPQNGEIYALAQYPFFDPSNYRAYYNDPERTEATKISAITDCFELGSTMKPITMAIAMLANQELKRAGKEGIFKPEEMIPVSSGQFPGRKQPIKDVGTHRFLNMYLAMQKSSNIYCAKLVDRIVKTLGEEWYSHKLESLFGFGHLTGIELPSESPGLLPRPHQSSLWSKPTPYSLSFGYNMLSNSLQLLRAYAILTNGGYFVKPTLVKKIVKGDQLLFQSSSEKGKQLFNPEISREIIYALKSVTKPGGGSWRAAIPGYTTAGKSGTTEKIMNGSYSKKNHYSSFIGFTPAFKPQFLVYVAIDEPEYRALPGVGKTIYGGRCAAPVFRRIMQKTYRYLGIPPDDPCGMPKGHPDSDPEKADWNQEVKVLKELYSSWNR